MKAEGAKEEKAAAEKSEDELEVKVDEEKKEHAKAEMNLEAEVKETKDAEKDLDESAKKLKKFRGADPDGGVTRSAAPSHSSFLALLGTVVFVSSM